MKSLHIVYFNYMQDLYGSSIGSTIKAERLIENLESMGHRVTQYWRFRDMDIGTAKVTAGQRSKIKSMLRRLLFTPKELVMNLVEMIAEYRFIRQHKPDVVIVRIDAYRYSASLLCYLLGIPLVLEADGANSFEWLTYNNRDGNIWKSWLLFVERFCFRVAQGVFVQSNIARQYYAGLYPQAAEKIVVISNGADLRPATGNDMRKTLEIPQDAVVCGFVGSMHYWHNTGLMTDLLADVMPSHPDLYMVLVGSGGPMAESLMQEYSRHDWTNRVRFTGYVPYSQTHLYINSMDITLAPYAKSDMFYYSPVKIFEYMAQGKAVVTTKVGQIEELIGPGENGMFFDPDTRGDLQRCVLSLYNDPKLRRQLGENARQSVLQAHTWAHKARQLDILLKGLFSIEQN